MKSLPCYDERVNEQATATQSSINSSLPNALKSVQLCPYSFRYSTQIPMRNKVPVICKVTGVTKRRYQGLDNYWGRTLPYAHSLTVTY